MKKKRDIDMGHGLGDFRRGGGLLGAIRQDIPKVHAKKDIYHEKKY